MSKRLCIISNMILLSWFFLDMIGINIGNRMLVSRSYKDDGIFFVIYVVLFVWFFIKDKLGKYVLSVWLIMWFITQFLSHWYFTIWGPSEDKIEYFANTIKFASASDRYIPDLYHIILHIVILFNVIVLMNYSVKSLNRKKVYG